MKLYAPSYGQEFVCIADRCRHSCCIGWEIDVDDSTMQIYNNLTEGYGTVIQNSIDTQNPPHFKLCEGDRCPHLDENGLCRIITNLGEGYLCHICREHPRFYNDTNRGKEMGFGMACEEACRLILTSENYRNIIEIGEVPGEVEEIDFDPLPYRDRIYDLLSDDALPYTHKLEQLAQSFGISLLEKSDGEWRTLLDKLEYLYTDHKAVFSVFTSDPTTPKALESYLERALAYFIYRHLPPVWDEDELSAAVGFSLFCERLIASVAKAEGICDVSGLIEIARIVSEELEYSEENTEEIKAAFGLTLFGEVSL